MEFSEEKKNKEVKFFTKKMYMCKVMANAVETQKK